LPVQKQHPHSLGLCSAHAHNARPYANYRQTGTPMSNIDVRHAHALPHDQARQAIEQVAGKLSERFGLQSNWRGDVLDFNGSGVDGAIALEQGAVRVTAKLGFLLSAMKGMVESEIQRVLKEKLG